MTPDDDALEATLHETRERVAWREADDGSRHEALREAQRTLEAIRRHRHRGQLPLWDPAQRAAARTVLLSVGCVLIITGAWAFDASLGGAGLVLCLGVLVFEATR